MSKNWFSRMWNDWNTDRIVGLSAIFISLLTLLTFVYQTNLMKKQAALSVLPYLSVSSSYNTGDSPYFKLSLVNEGVGPAIIESRKVIFKGKEYNQDLFDFLEDQDLGIDTLDHISHSSFDYGSVLPSGEDKYLIAAFNDSEIVDFLAYSLEKLQEEGLDYEIVFRSIYGERWRITNDASLPEQLADVEDMQKGTIDIL